MFVTMSEKNWTALIEQLKTALREQWEWNHAEHCSNVEWPHPEGEICTWPLPVLLGGDPSIYRTYDEATSTYVPRAARV